MISFKNFILCLGFIFLLFFGIPIRISNKSVEEVEFNNFIKRYNKLYENETIYQRRFEAFKDSLASIEQLNKLRTNNLSARYGITKFSDMSTNEFENHHLLKNLNERIRLRTFLDDDDSTASREKRSMSIQVPLKVDWRTKGVVTDVNNQRSCGACWAFSTIETIESMFAIKNGTLTKLSTQQFIDCAGMNNSGCDGGDVCSLLFWLKRNNIKIQSDSQYPLHLKNEKCKMNDTAGGGGVSIKDFSCESLINDEEYMVASLALRGPIAVAINAISWQNYLGGVIQYHCSSDPIFLNHAVQIVGYDKESDIPHYIVRNSWGKDFGDDGYLYIAIGNNLCGLANEVSVVVV